MSIAQIIKSLIKTIKNENLNSKQMFLQVYMLNRYDEYSYISLL